MSFYDAVPLEAQQPFSDSPEFDELVESISNDLFSINTDLVTLSKFINSLSLKSQQRKDHNLHDKTLSLSENTTSKFKSLGELKCRLKQWDEPTPGQQFTIEKLSREMNEAFTDFQALQTKLADAEKQNVLEARTALEENEQREQVVLLQRDDDTTEGNQLLMQEEPMNPQEFDYQQTLITEREEEIQNIEQGILELNEIFTDLGAIVVQQGLVLDNIESNMYNISTSTQNAAAELTKAADYQKRSRGKSFCLLMILSIILTVILLAMFLG